MASVRGMRTGGQNKIAAAIHKLRGTYRGDRHAPRSPPLVAAAPAALPKTPKGLSPASQALWRRFHTEYELTSVPAQELLESALRSRDLAERARAELERDGLTYADRGKPKPHPAAQIHRDSRAAFVATLKVLGFPADEGA